MRSNPSINSGGGAGRATGNHPGIPAGPAGRGPAQLNVRGRGPSSATLPQAPVMPAELARTLNTLQQHLSQFKPNEAELEALQSLAQRLHHLQHDIETGLREYANQAVVGRLCQALLDFVQRLDTALDGKAKRLRSTAGREPLRNKLPLCSLNPAQIEVLCLGVSALVSNRSRQPFPKDHLGAARAAISSIAAKLMKQLQAWGGVASLAHGSTLNIGNLIRRGVTAGMLDVRAAQHEATRDYCKEEFAAIADYADKALSFDNAHDLGKCAAQVEMLYDYGLHGLSKAQLGTALENILAWLSSKKAVDQMLADSSLGAFSGVLNLAKRFLEQGMLNADDRNLDVMWERLVAGIAAQSISGLASQDVRSLTACANLLRTILKAGLAPAWRQAQVEGGPDLAGQFNTAVSKVVSAIIKLDSSKMHDLQHVGNLLSLIEACERQMSESEAVFGATLARASLQDAAQVLLNALPQARLAGQRNMQTLTNLFNALGTLWHRGLLAQSDRGVQCLLNMLDALAATQGWDVAHAGSCVQVLIWLRQRDLVSMDDLQPVLNRLLGEKSGGWTEQAMLSRWREQPVSQTGPVLQLQPSPRSGDGEPRPRSPRLVGETALKPETSSPPTAETWRASDYLPHALAQQDAPFEVATRTARRSSSTTASIFPLPVPFDPEEEGEHCATAHVTTTTSVDIATTSTAITTTTSTTSTTTTTSIALTPAVPDAPADPGVEWWRLLRLRGVDPVRKLSALANEDLLKALDEQGHDVLWHLVLGGKPLSLAALMDRMGWRPVLSEQLLRELELGFFTMGHRADVASAMQALMPSLDETQRTRLRAAMQAQPSDEAYEQALALVQAMGKGEVDRVTALLECNADAALSTAQIQALLSSCVAGGEPEILDLLLKRPGFRAQLGERFEGQQSLLHIALYCLITDDKSSASSLDSPKLKVALRLIAEPAVRKAAWAADKEGNHALALAVAQGNVQLLRTMLKYEEARALLSGLSDKLMSALVVTLIDGHEDLLAALLEAKVSPHLHTHEVKGKNLLEWAVEKGRPELVRLLLKSMREDKRVHRRVENMEWNKRTPLVTAAVHAKLWDLVPDLLAVDVLARQAGKIGPDEKTALYKAVSEGAVETVRQLLKHASVQGTIFLLAEEVIEVTIPASSNSVYAGKTGLALHKMDAMAKAIENGSSEIVEIFLALDKVRQRLAQNRELWQSLVNLAVNEGHAQLAKRLREF